VSPFQIHRDLPLHVLLRGELAWPVIVIIIIIIIIIVAVHLTTLSTSEFVYGGVDGGLVTCDLERDHRGQNKAITV
jgi:hypothetical protein